MSEKESLKRIRLTVEGGPTREFPGDRAFVIGRSQNVDFSIPHPNLSREHVRISLKNGDVWLEDLGSANGTFVQGQRLPPKSVVQIKPHYRVLLGTGSNVIITVEAVESSEPLIAAPVPKGDVDLPTEHERTKTSQRLAPGRPAEFEASKTNTKARGKMELDFPMQHFPQEAKKEKAAELRILEAKKQRVLEDIQYKEREVDDLRSKIRDLREETLKLKAQTEAYKSEIQPLEERKQRLEDGVAELDVTFEEKIDSLESGFADLKQTLEESHAARMARADKDYKDKMRRLDGDYARKLEDLESETIAVRGEGERLRDTLIREKRELEENLKRVRSEAEALDADMRLKQVRIDTEIAQLQGTKMKLENELESFRRKHEKIAAETNAAFELGRTERAKLAEMSKALADVRAEHERFTKAAKAEQEQTLRAVQIEQEQFKKGIEAMKQSESVTIHRIDELKNTIQTLEKKSHGIEAALEQAEIDAGEIRRKGQEEVERLKRIAQEQLEEERLLVSKNAEAQALRAVQEAHAEALARIETAGAQADFRLSEAAAQADARITEANAQASARIEAGDAQASARMEKAAQDSRVLLERAQTEANQYYEAKKMAADELFGSVQARAQELENGSKNHAERVASEAKALLESKRRALEMELVELRKRTEAEIRQVRQNALGDIEAAKDREAKEFVSRLKGRVKEIGDQVDRIVGSKLAAQYGVNMDPAAMKAFSDDIHRIVENVIGPAKGNSSGSGEKTLSSVLPLNSQAQERAVRYWKKMGIVASVVFVLLLGKVVVPEVYTFIGKHLASAVDIKDNTDAVVKRMIRERQLAMTFVTPQDQRIRDTYTDNILYTEGFIEMKEDEETQRAWTLGLNKFFQGELGLTEKAIVQFGSAEGRMIRDLIDLRKEIIPTTAAAGIQKMRDMEAPIVKEMRFIVRSEGNWQRFQAYHRDFYTKYTQTVINRAPASKDSAP